jgi:hypothetical protein
MTVRKEPVERRKHKRFQACQGACAVLRPHSNILGQNIDILGQIIDISRGGLGLRYVARENRSDESFELDILLAGDSFHLDKVSFQTIEDVELAKESTFSPATVRRRGLQFEKLAHWQMSRLEYFIRNHAGPPGSPT